MSFVKHGTGEVLDEDEATRKTAAGPFTDEDKRELAAENDKADQ